MTLLEWLLFILLVFGLPIAYRMGRDSGVRQVRPPAKQFFNHEEDGL